MTVPPDAAVRSRALDVAQSFIVQAPAGSGKTELLTQRFLKLLAVSSGPEQVLAITFTKKAASEMQSRILSTLQWANESTEQQLKTDYDRQRHEIARSVLLRDQELGWQLLRNPGRLRVQTIDSLSFFLAQQLPVLSKLGVSAAADDDPTEVYLHAINRTLEQLNQDGPLADDIALLLRHMDNSVSRVQQRLMALLGQRDQWLPFLLDLSADPAAAQRYLHSSVEGLIAEQLDTANHLLKSRIPELQPLLEFAVKNLEKDPPKKNKDLQTLVAQVAALNCELIPDIANLPCWQLLSYLFLTQQGSWRKAGGITKGIGFPPESPEGGDKDLYRQQKAAFTALLTELQQDEAHQHPEKLGDLLRFIITLPQLSADQSGWEFLDALSRVLMSLGTQLLLSFSELGRVDYTQISSAASTALGDDLAPTELALALDHRLQHILIDEFQDTSQLQLDLLLQLTRGWQPGDGRSLFLVGDAMQSCYLFRNANVGIFLEVRERGLGYIYLEPLTLQANFRSQANVVNWVNQVFSQAFPDGDDSALGAVAYSHSIPIKDSLDQRTVTGTAFVVPEDQKELGALKEAERIVVHIKELQRSDPGSNIAILVRGRSHLKSILPTLRDNGIAYQATEIDYLGSQAVIDDLISLTLAILDSSDDLSWASLLRAPWGALNSSEILTLQLAARDCGGLCFLLGTLMEQSTDAHPALAALSEQSRQRLMGIAQVMAVAMAQRLRRPLDQLVRETWIRLGGPQLLMDGNEAVSAEQFFTTLQAEQNGFGLRETARFEAKVRAAFVPPPPAQDRNSHEGDLQPVQVLTMHKAKGLEYDHVILPELNKPPPSDNKPLIIWHQRIDREGNNRLFLAAQTREANSDTESKKETDNALYALIRGEQKKKASFEDTRLLYIAVTRACKSALLLASLQEPRDSSKPPKPNKNSLLERIWLGDHLELPGFSLEQLTALPEQPEAILSVQQRSLRRTLSLPALSARHAADWQEAQTRLLDSGSLEADSALPRTRLIEQQRRSQIGVLVHRAFELILKGTAPAAAISTRYWRAQLAVFELEPELLASSLEQIERHIRQTLESGETAWLFDRSQSEIESEVSLSDELNKRHIVDLTFVDAQGVRWIVDFKTGQPEPGEQVDQFGARMRQSYAGQLARYRRLFSAIDPRPVRCALCLSALPALVEFSEQELELAQRESGFASSTVSIQ